MYWFYWNGEQVNYIRVKIPSWFYWNGEQVNYIGVKIQSWFYWNAEQVNYIQLSQDSILILLNWWVSKLCPSQDSILVVYWASGALTGTGWVVQTHRYNLILSSDLFYRHVINSAQWVSIFNPLIISDLH